MFCSDAGVVKISSVKKCKEFDNHILTSAL